MVHRVLKPTFLFLALLLLGGCEESQSPGPASSDMVVSFLDRGAVVPNPVSTLVVIGRLRISSESTQGGVAIHSWESEIEQQDYEQMTAIVQSNHLIGAPDPSIGASPCVGASEMLVIFGVGGLLDTLKIAGVARCDTTTWPAGLNSLVRFKDALVAKYGSQNVLFETVVGYPTIAPQRSAGPQKLTKGWLSSQP